MEKSTLTAEEYRSMFRPCPKPGKTVRKGRTVKKFNFYQTPAWKYLAKCVKLQFCDANYMVRCFTCGKPMLITDKKCHAGHLIKVRDSNNSNYSVAFEKENVGINCYQCNVYSGGKQDLMLKKLEGIYGKEAIDNLYQKRHNVCKLDQFTLDYWKNFYKSQFDILIKIKGNPWKK